MSGQTQTDLFSSLFVYNCSSCNSIFEAEEYNLCAKCSEAACDFCQFTCKGCEETYCQGCSWTCHLCQNKMCEDCFDFSQELCKFCKLEQEQQEVTN